jgi:hypothetical protein
MTTTVVIMEGTDVMPKSVGSGPKVGFQWGWMIGFILLTLALALITKALRQSNVLGVEGPGIFFLVMAVLSTGASMLYWRGLDEPSREAHKFAVFWGAGFVLLFVGLLGVEMMFFSGLRDIAQGWVEGWIAITDGDVGRQQGAVGFYLGMVASSTLLVLGYAVVWAGWWVRQRMGPKAD